MDKQVMVQRTSEPASAPIGHPAVDDDALWTLLDIAAHGGRDDLRRELERITTQVHLTCIAGTPLTETEKLLDEALWYLRAGDNEEALYRLQQADEAFEQTDVEDEDEEQYA